MQSKVQKWGNSLALRLPKYISSQLNVTNGSPVDISVQEEKIIIKPIEDKKETLDYYLSKINQDNIHSEHTFGEPVGGEVW